METDTCKEEQPPKPPSLSNARSFISQTGGFPGLNSHAADATTAVTLKISDQAEISMYDQEHGPQDLYAAHLNIPSIVESLASMESSDGEEESEASHIGLQLPEMVHDLMLASNNQQINRKNDSSDSGHNNPLTGDNTPFSDGFLRHNVLADKLEQHFKSKLKHFFVLSAAGKPIYSLNGNDNVLMGYMGLITTIMASFQEDMKRDLHSISLDQLTIVVKNQGPLVLVAVSKIAHERSSHAFLESQLDCLYNYIVAILSKSVIAKNFNAGMNYDLRRLLTVQDFRALDILLLKLTYGIYQPSNHVISNDTSFLLGARLDHALRCIRISNTCRTKLTETLLAAKKLTYLQENPDYFSSVQHSLQIAEDLLFAFVTVGDKVVSYLRPRKHKLENTDICTMLSVVFLSSTGSADKNTDLWIPVCMPEFNSSGFLYCYVRTFMLGSHPLTIILMSGSKNSFYNMKDAAKYIVAKIQGNKRLSTKLSYELSHFRGQISILKELKITSIKHFIHKRKEFNQVFMDDTIEEMPLSESLLRVHGALQIIALYSDLISSKGTQSAKKLGKMVKKLTYTRLRSENDGMLTGFFLADEKYEFYCVCAGPTESQVIIDESVRIIKWCERYKKRLFVQDGLIF